MKALHHSSLTAAIVIASIWSLSGGSLQAQATAGTAKTDKPAAKEILVERDSVSVADVQKAAEQLSIAVQEAVRKVTEDPALKVAALKVAKSAVGAAQVAITQQAETLQSVLDNLAREIAQATERQSERHSEKQVEKPLPKTKKN